MEPNANERPTGWRSSHGLIPGLIVILIGVLFLLDNFHVIDIAHWWLYWPVALIAVGLVKLVDSNSGTGRVIGGILLGTGAIFLGNNLGVIAVTFEQLWPLLLIAVGVIMLSNRIFGLQWYEVEGRWDKRWDRHRWRQGRWNQAPGQNAGDPPSPHSLNEVAIFGGGKRKVTTQDFRGGELTAIFGGFEVDLRNAGMTADSAILEVNTVFGGAEIRIPYAWTAVVQGVGIFGGYGDETTPPEPGTNPNSKKLFVRGAAVFGGVEVKN